MEIVPFLLAKKLKEKGFKQGYNIFGFRPIFSDETTIRFISDIGAYENEYFGENITAPTISQVLKWLREECGIFILVEPDILSPEYKLTFTLRVKFYIKGEEDEGFSEKYLTYRRDSYELAALAGIEYCLDNLI